MREYYHWIDSQSVSPSGAARLTRLAPGDGRAIATVPLGSAADVDAAVNAARRAFDKGGWSIVPGAERGEALNRLADLMVERHEELARLEAEEAGKPIKAARLEIDVSVRLTRYAASLAWDIAGRAMTDAGTDRFGLVFRQPRGVAGLIVAWNYPCLCLMQKLPYALAAGCSVVIKPSEFTPGTTLLIAELAGQAGIPQGQINVVIGMGDVVGEAMTDHPGIDMISFTGSSRVGRRVAARCAERLKHCTLELGGKGTNIVFADADIDRAVEATYTGFTFNAGQECCSSAKIVVERSVANDFIDRLVARCRAAKIGVPFDEAAEIGPLIHEQHLDRVMGYIAQGQNDGARLLTGGKRLTSGELAKGLFVSPTLLDNVQHGMSIYAQEIFGPVACLSTFDTLEEALTIANDTVYGLANGVWTSSLDRAMTIVRRLKSGMVYVNTYLESLPQLPLGGLKDSGHGVENGAEGLSEFLETRSAFFRIQPQ